MKSVKFIALASWMLEHLTSGLTREALISDLLEQLQQGRSTARYWRCLSSSVPRGLRFIQAGKRASAQLTMTRSGFLGVLICDAHDLSLPGDNARTE
jgi:hypothetical protein